MWIMIAAPYTSGGADAALRGARLAEMNQAALAILRLGHVPVIGVNMALPIIAAAEGEVALPPGEEGADPPGWAGDEPPYISGVTVACGRCRCRGGGCSHTGDTKARLIGTAAARRSRAAGRAAAMSRAAGLLGVRRGAGPPVVPPMPGRWGWGSIETVLSVADFLHASSLGYKPAGGRRRLS